MRAGRRRGVELIPEFRRLIAHVPSAFGAARREHPFLGARRLLVAADAGDQAVEAVFGKCELQSLGLARGGSRGRRQRRIDRLDRRAGFDPEIEIPFLAVAIAKRVHLRKFLAGIDMQGRKRHPPEEGLACQPDHDVGILAQRPQQRQLLQPREGFPENVDALGLERVQMIHGRISEVRCKHASVGGDWLDRRSCAIIVEKMHLRPLVSADENSIVAPQYGRNNFPFTGIERDIYRK